MAYDGEIRIKSDVDSDGFSKGVASMGNILKSAGIFKAFEAGMDLIRGSIDKAFGRIDTMEQFNRVMTTMTGSTTQANRALDKTATIVTGTAYGLDVAAAAVQSFVSRGATIEQATQRLQSYSDAVAFYGDGTNATLASVTDALGKMQTKGNVTMQNLQVLLQAGIPAVEIYAEATGQMASDVTDAMAEGALASEEFIDVLGAALDNGAGKFPGISGAAKDAGASWQGTFDNMRAAITRGVQSIITSIDDTQAALGRPTMREAIASFGKGFESALKLAAQAIVPLLTNLETVIPVVSGLTAAYLVLTKGQAANNAINAAGLAISNAHLITKVKDAAQLAILGVQYVTLAAKQAAAAVASVIMTGSTVGLTAAFGALGVAIWAALAPLLPFIAIGLALTGLVVGLVAWFNRESDAVKKNNAELEKLKETQDELNSSIADSAAAYTETQNSIEGQAAASETLLGKLDELRSKESLTAAEKVKMKLYTDQLNDATEGLNLTLDEETGKLSMTTDEIRKVIESNKALAGETAVVDRYTELVSELSAAEAQIYALTAAEEGYLQQLNDGIIDRWEYNDAVKKNNALMEEALATKETVTREMGALEGEYTRIVEQNERIRQQEQEAQQAAHEARLEELAKKYHLTTEEIQEELDKNNQDVEEWVEKNGEKLEENARDLEKASAAWGVSIDTIKQEMADQELTLDQWVSAQEKAWQDFENSVKERASGVVNGFKKIPGEFEKTGWELLEVLQTNKERYAAWEKNMEAITRELGPTAAEEFGKLGPEANSALEQILASTDLLDEYRDVFGVKIDEATGQAIEDWNDPKFIGAASSAIDQSAEQVRGNTAIQDATEEALAANKVTQAVDSNAEAYAAAGDTMAEAIATGMGRSGSKITEALAQAIISSSGQIAESAQYIGVAVADGAEQGLARFPTVITSAMTKGSTAIRSSSTQFNTATRTVTNGVLSTLQPFPGRFSQVFTQAMSQAQSAINNRRSLITGAASSVASGTVSALQSMISGARNAAYSMMDGISYAMSSRAPGLYAQARNIANNIASTMASALKVQSPSRIMIALFGHVMDGISVGMVRKKDEVLDTVTGIANDIMDAFGTGSLYDSLAGLITAKPMTALTTAQTTGYGAGAARGGYVDNATYNFYNPQALSPSEQTREMLYQKKKLQWALP